MQVQRIKELQLIMSDIYFNNPKYQESFAHYHNIIMYDIDYSEYDRVTDALAESIAFDSDVQSFIGLDDMRNFTHCALEVYHILTYRNIRMGAGQKDECIGCLRDFSSLIKIPVYFKDAIREICRPMVIGDELWVPRIPSCDDRFMDKVLQLRSLLGLLPIIFNKFKIPCVSIGEELVKPLPYCIWNSETKKVSFGASVPEFRLDFINAMKSFRLEKLKFKEIMENDKAKLETEGFIGDSNGVFTLQRDTRKGLLAPPWFPPLLFSVGMKFPTILDQEEKSNQKKNTKKRNNRTNHPSEKC